MGLFPFYVETVDIRSNHNVLAEFRHRKPAESAARRALDSPRVVLAVVKNRDGAMVYAYDGIKEWRQIAEDASDRAERVFGDQLGRGIPA